MSTTNSMFTPPGAPGLPGKRPSFAPSPLIRPPDNDLPQIEEMTRDQVQPSLLIVGGSGTGKTHGIKSVIEETGLRTLVLAVEDKVQVLARATPRPLVQYISTPTIVDGKKVAPTYTAKYNRLMLWQDRLAAGEYREFDGSPIKLIATDGIMEYAEVIARHHKANMPMSDGKKDTFAFYDMVGDKIVDALKALRSAANTSAKVYGYPPVGIIATVGENWYEPKLGPGSFKPILPGRKGLDALPYQFEAIIRLSAEVGEDGQPVYIAHTVASDTWTAKVPPGLFPPRVILYEGGEKRDSIGNMYLKLVEYYNKDS